MTRREALAALLAVPAAVVPRRFDETYFFYFPPGDYYVERRVLVHGDWVSVTDTRLSESQYAKIGTFIPAGVTVTFRGSHAITPR